MILLDLAVRAVLLLVLVAFVLGCVAMFLDAHAKTSREALDAAIARHPAKGTDPVRLAQMVAIAEAEEAWDRDVWGDPAQARAYHDAVMREATEVVRRSDQQRKGDR